MKKPIIHRKLVKVLLRKRADAKTAANEREPAIRLRALGARGAIALSRIPASAILKRNPTTLKHVILAVREHAR